MNLDDVVEILVQQNERGGLEKSRQTLVKSFGN